MAGYPVELLRGEEFAVAVSRVPEDEFGTEVLESRMQDLSWVGERGLRHESVVAWFVDHASILPARLLTLFSSEDALSAEIEERAEAIRGRLQEFADLREWDVKVSFAAEKLADHLGEVSDEIADLEEEIEHAKPGRQFLLRRKRDDRVRALTERTAADLGRELLEALRPHAERARVLPVPREADSLPVVLNAAMLVHRTSESELASEVRRRGDRLEELGVSVQFSGPWAPYRFLSEDEQ